MQLVMVYFSGSGVQIFSMGMVAVLIASPFKAWAAMSEGQFCPLRSIVCRPGRVVALAVPRTGFIHHWECG